MFEALFNNPFLYSLSLTLLHFLWQGLLVGIILKLALLVIDKKQSKYRYGLAMLAMFSNAILAICTFVIVYPDTGSTINTLSPIPLTSLVNELTQQGILLTYQELVLSILAYALPYISLLWIATIAILAGKLLIEVRNVNHLPLQASIPPNATLLARFDELAKQIKLPKTPRLLITLKAEVPMAIGWLKPVVLLPASMVTNLNSEQLEMLILHELAHILRHDYLVNFLQTLIELLFFFHPCVHWIGKQMRNEREYCSDDIAVQYCGNAIAYAHTLTDTASLCAQRCANNHFSTIPAMAMAASGGDLKARVLRLVDNHHCAPTNSTSKWLAAISLILVLTLLGMNQLLTMPFALHLKSQLPWQENNRLSQGRLIPSLAQVSNANNGEYFLSATGNSIAIQLLNEEKDLSQEPLIKLINPQHETAQLLNNNILLNNALTTQLKTTALKAKPLKNSGATPEAIDRDITELNIAKLSVAELNTAEPNRATLTSALKIKPLKSNVKTAKIAKKSSEVNVQKINQLRSKNNIQLVKQTNQKVKTTLNLVKTSIKTSKESTLEVVTLIADSKINKTDSAKVNSLTSYIDEKNDRLQVANLSSKILKSDKTSDTDITPIISQRASEELSNTLKHKNTRYPELSYNKEINKLARESEQHEAPYKINDNNSQIFDNEEKQHSTPKHIQVNASHDAKLLKSTSPVYPSLAKRRGIEREVQVNFTIDRNGKVKDIDFGKQNKITYFKSSIRSAISKWRFTPAIRNNDIIESKMSKIFSFSLQS